MQLLFLLLCLFVKPAFLQESQWAKLIFQIGAPVMPAGQTVKMFCMVSFVVNKYTWYRLNKTTWTAMNINNKSLTLIVTTKDSGEYKCSGYYNGTRYDSNAVNLTVVGSVYAGVAGLVLVLIAGVLLTLLLLWLWRQRAKEKAGQETLATNSAPAKGYTGPAKAPKGKSQAQAGNEGEVYINCGESNQAYSDLYPTYMTGDDTYATLG